VTGKPWRAVPGGVEIRLRVTPRSRLDGIAGLHAAADGSVSLAVKVRALPDKGAANAAVIETLSEALGVPKSRIALASGSTGRHKTVVVEGRSDQVEERIVRALGQCRGEKD
jgi:uncharacterized protein